MFRRERAVADLTIETKACGVLSVKTQDTHNKAQPRTVPRHLIGAQEVRAKVSKAAM